MISNTSKKGIGVVTMELMEKMKVKVNLILRMAFEIIKKKKIIYF